MATASGSLPRASGRSLVATGPRAARSRRRRIVGLVLFFVALAVLWEVAKWLGGDPWRLHATIAGVADRLRTRPAAHVADRRRPVAAASLGHRPRLRRPSPARRRAARDRAGRPGGVHARRGVRGVRARWPARARARCLLRPLEAGRAGARPVRRRLADGADPGHRPARRRGDQGRLAVGDGRRRRTSPSSR